MAGSPVGEWTDLQLVRGSGLPGVRPQELCREAEGCVMMSVKTFIKTFAVGVWLPERFRHVFVGISPVPGWMWIRIDEALKADWAYWSNNQEAFFSDRGA